VSRAVQVKVQPGQALRFPAQCVYCGAAAEPALRLRHRIGRVTREVHAPLCADCRQEVRRLSFDEERWQKQGWLAAGLVLVLLFAAVLLLSPGAIPLGYRLLFALGVAGLAVLAVLSFFRQRSLRYARPEKQAILAAAHLTDFTWQTMTLRFADASYARRFGELNEPMEMVDSIPLSQTEVVT
jgi:hypothetical protein